MFRFVGEGSFFNAHRKLVAYVSEPLKAKMLAHDGAALLFEVDKATFGRFLEWCYTGDYNAAKVQHLYEIDSEDEDASDEEAGELNPAGEADGTTGLGWTAALERTEALMVEDSFQDANDEIPITVANDEEMGEDETDEDDEDDEVDRLGKSTPSDQILRTPTTTCADRRCGLSERQMALGRHHVHAARPA